jgi:tetratricopeptide (TPR) repeat protein
MRAHCSFISGLCVLEDSPEKTMVFDALQENEVPIHNYLQRINNIDEWYCVDAPDLVTLCRQVRKEHNFLRAVLDVEQSLLNLQPHTVLELLRDVEELLQAGVSARHLTSQLLIAPLLDPQGIRDRAKKALSDGLGATGDILATVAELQPRLSAFVGHWLEVPELLFIGFSGGRKSLWKLAARDGVLGASIQATSAKEFGNLWAELIFRQPTAQARAVISRVSKVLSERLFPQRSGLSTVFQREKALDDSSPMNRWRGGPQKDPRIEHEQALKQVDNIVALISKGHDTQARRFLRELVAAQTAREDLKQHAVKSLCKIAKQCADLFRTDFEKECLQTALEICPADSWTLTQFGDHYKRVGQYDFALDCLNHATSGAKDIELVLSAIADVHAEMGDFDGAIAKYRAIDKTGHQTAIADILRKARRFSEARALYERLIAEGLGSHRAKVGLAEIDKQEGRPSSARDRYQEILYQPDLDERSRLIYRNALAGIFVRTGELEKAFEMADGVVQSAPFFMQGLILRASILGLLGKANSGLESLPPGTPTAFGEWTQQYVRGLLLLLLDRFKDARNELKEILDSPVVEKDGRSLLRLGAAIAFLETNRDSHTVTSLLDEAELSLDPFLNYLVIVLRYHVAVMERNQEAIAALEKTLTTLPVGPLQNAVASIRQGQWKEAIKWEARVLLRLAA